MAGGVARRIEGGERAATRRSERVRRSESGEKAEHLLLFPSAPSQPLSPALQKMDPVMLALAAVALGVLVYALVGQATPRGPGE